jgi:LmeA-like phospholipid-binding
VTDPWARPNQPPPPPQQFPQNPPPGYPAPSAGQGPDQPPAPKQESSLAERVKDLFRDPLSVVLVLVIVVALVLAGVIGGELYGRHRADSVVATAVECVVRDDAKVSFGVWPPFLMQHMSGHYTNIHIETAGNQVRDAKGMKVNIEIDDVRLQDTPTSTGSIGSLVATINWSADGIKQTIQNAVPLVGAFVTGVKTDPSAGTIELDGALGSITAKPAVVDNGISLQVTEVTGLGFTLPRETVQPALDAFTSQLTKNYPLGIHADSVAVTDDGVVSQFSTKNASMPKEQQDPCFAGL